MKLDEADTATGGLLFDVVEVIERVERQAPPRGHRRLPERRGAASSGRARQGRSGQTVATTKLDARAHLGGHVIGRARAPSISGPPCAAAGAAVARAAPTARCSAAS